MTRMAELVRKQFTFYASYYNAVRSLSESKRLAAYDAIADYAFCRREPKELKGEVAMVFALVKPTLDAAHRRSRKYREEQIDWGATGFPTSAKSRVANTCFHEGEKKGEEEVEKKVEKKKEEDSLCSAGGFEAFWEQYPRKVERSEAQRAWSERAQDENQVMALLGAWKASENWAREGGRFIPKAASFLRDGRYAAAPEAPQRRTLDADERASILRMMKEEPDEEEK